MNTKLLKVKHEKKNIYKFLIKKKNTEILEDKNVNVLFKKIKQTLNKRLLFLKKLRIKFIFQNKIKFKKFSKSVLKRFLKFFFKLRKKKKKKIKKWKKKFFFKKYKQKYKLKKNKKKLILLKNKKKLILLKKKKKLRFKTRIFKIKKKIKKWFLNKYFLQKKIIWKEFDINFILLKKLKKISVKFFFFKSLNLISLEAKNMVNCIYFLMKRLKYKINQLLVQNRILTLQKNSKDILILDNLIYFNIFTKSIKVPFLIENKKKLNNYLNIFVSKLKNVFYLSFLSFFFNNALQEKFLYFFKSSLFIFNKLFFVIKFFFSSIYIFKASVLGMLIARTLSHRINIRHIILPILKSLKKKRILRGIIISIKGRYMRRSRASATTFKFGYIPYSSIKFNLDYYEQTVVLRYGVTMIRIWCFLKKQKTN